MSNDTVFVSFNQEELAALGITLNMWRAQHVGTDARSGFMLAMLLDEMDREVFLAHLDRLTVRLSLAECEFDDEDKFEGLDEQRTRLNAELDQRFAKFAEEGRTLFHEAPDDD